MLYPTILGLALIAPQGNDPGPGVLEASGRFWLCQDVWLTCGSGTHEIAGTNHFQVCDPVRCLPPRSLEFSGKLRVR